METGTNLLDVAETQDLSSLAIAATDTFQSPKPLSGLASYSDGSGSGIPIIVEELTAEITSGFREPGKTFFDQSYLSLSNQYQETQSPKSIENSDDLTGQVFSSLEIDKDSLLAESSSLAVDYLTNFKNSTEYFEAIQISFGEDTSKQKATALIDSIVDGSSSVNLEIVTIENPDTIAAFSETLNTIYLSEQFVMQNIDNPESIAAILLEEWGHYLDSALNTYDSAGDEGAVFSSLVRGFDPDLSFLKSEDDHTTLTINGKDVLVEQAAFERVLLNNNPVFYVSDRGSILGFVRNSRNRLGVDIFFRDGVTGQQQLLQNVQGISIFNGQFSIVTSPSSSRRTQINPFTGQIEFVSGDQNPLLTVNAPRWSRARR